MKVVHVAAYFAPAWAAGGPARSLLTLCQAQRAAGIDVEVFTTTANGGGELPPQPEGVVHEGVPVRYFPLTPPRALFAASTMWRPLDRALERADVAHLHGLFNATVWIASRLARQRVPYVISPRGMLQDAALRHHRWRKRASWRMFDRAALHNAARVHATSPLEAEVLRKQFDRAPMVDIPNPVPLIARDAAEIARARQLVSLPREPYILFLGRIHPIKRLDLLARAFASVTSQVPGAHLVIAGPDERGARLALEPQFAPCAGHVHWTGEVDGAIKRGLLAGARALVLCSDSESFGMSAAEAMAAGTAVVVTRTCPWPAIEAEGCGYWIDQTADAIARALIDLLRDADDAAEMGRRGQALIQRDFAPAAVAERWRAVYRELAPQPHRPALSCA